MPAPPLASLSDFRVRIPGGIADEDEARAEAALEDASSWVRAEARRTWVDDDGNLAVPDNHAIAITIVLAVARRVFDNPEGVIQSTIDGASEMLVNPTADTYLTAGERIQLRQLRPSANRGLSTISTTRGEDLDRGLVPVTGYAPPDLGTEPRGAKAMPWNPADYA